MVLLVQAIAPNDEALLAVAYAIRQRVFLDEYGLDPALDTEPTDADPTTLHFVGFDTDSQQYVAVARSVLLADGQTVQLGRIAVLPEARGRRHGLTIMQFAVKFIRAWQDVRVQKMILFCPKDKRPFYQRSGFTHGDNVEMVRGLELYEMVQLCNEE